MLIRDRIAVCAIEVLGRDALAWRAAKGEPLTRWERARLWLADAILDRLDTGAEPLPPDVQAIVRDVLEGRAPCPTCGQHPYRRTDGTLLAHRAPPFWWWCPGGTGAP